jgi:hypothetical protein
VGIHGLLLWEMGPKVGSVRSLPMDVRLIIGVTAVSAIHRGDFHTLVAILYVRVAISMQRNCLLWIPAHELHHHVPPVSVYLTAFTAIHE